MASRSRVVATTTIVLSAAAAYWWYSRRTSVRSRKAQCTGTSEAGTASDRATFASQGTDKELRVAEGDGWSENVNGEAPCGCVTVCQEGKDKDIWPPQTCDGSGELEDIRPRIDFSAPLESRLAPIMAMDDFQSTLCVPEAIDVHVRTFGCSHNMSDSEVMMGLLKQAGFNLVDDWKDADVSVLNSCTVKNPSQDGAVNLAVKIREANKGVVVAGCVVQADETIPQLQNVSTLGVKQIDKIVEAVLETASGNVYKSISFRRELPRLDLPKVRRNELIEIIPLSTGCLGACTYCKTRHARGALGSYAQNAILERVAQAVNEGVQQIWLTSEDTGAYGIDLGTNIAELLEGISETIQRLAPHDSNKHVMVRLGMTNPPYMLEHLERLANVLKGSNFFEFLHIPIQSGSNAVLLGMNREYTVEDFHLCAEGMRERIPNLSLATDFICGFPNETEEDHQMSVELLRRYKFPSVNISQFYPRPGTPAAKMKRVPTNVVKSRSKEMTETFMSYGTLDNWVGQNEMVWFSGISEKSDHVVGHTKQYIKVLVERDDSLIGTNRMCHFTACSKWHLVGAVL